MGDSTKIFLQAKGVRQMELEITTARQMKKLLKAKRQEKSLAKKKLKANEVADAEVIYEIIEKFKESDFALKTRCVTIYDDARLVGELENNFNAYKKAFRKLGYRLYCVVDCSGTAYDIRF